MRKRDCSDALEDPENRLFVLELLLHTADVSNVMKPTNLCQKWSLLIQEEFFAQGDKERSLGLPVSKMMDRETVDLATLQMGFIEFVIRPLVIRK